MKKYKTPSQPYAERASQCIAHGALTNSKRAESFVKGVYPVHLKRGHGCHVWDYDDKKYVDFICGLGSNLLGYAHEGITQAIQKRALLGSTLSLGTGIEVEVAEKVKEIFPFVEKIRFLKTGSEACSASLRIARAYRPLNNTISEGYHGWHDDFVSMSPPGNGVPKRDWMFSGISDFAGCAMSSMIIEPIVTDASETRIQWLRDLRERCTNSNTVLIFDEVITGFRFPNFCVSSHINVIPDLIVLGKAMGGGMPISVVGGKADIMDSDYFVSSTFAGETLSLAASLKLMNLLQSDRYPLDDLWAKGTQFMNQFNEIWPDGLTLEGYATRSVFKGEELTKALFMQECCKAGILVGPSFFFIFPHIELMDEVLSTFADILKRVRSGNLELEGEMPVKPFAEKVRKS